MVNLHWQAQIADLKVRTNGELVVGWNLKMHGIPLGVKHIHMIFID